MEHVNSTFGLLWIIMTVGLGYCILAFKFYKKHIKPQVLLIGVIVFSIIILALNGWCAYHMAEIVGDRSLWIIIGILCLALCFIDFGCLAGCYEILVSKTLDQNKIYKFQPEAFGYVRTYGEYSIYLRGKIIDVKRPCEAFIISHQTWKTPPSLQQPKTVLYEKVGVRLTDLAKKRLKKGKLTMNVIIDSYDCYKPLNGPTVVALPFIL